MQKVKILQSSESAMIEDWGADNDMVSLENNWKCTGRVFMKRQIGCDCKFLREKRGGSASYFL